MKNNDLITRKEFFVSCIRYFVLGAITLYAGVQLIRRGKRPLAGQECVNKGICRGCNTFNKCELPQAQSAKRAQG
jgi:hypothetical protein